jgi:hypothetical protein
METDSKVLEGKLPISYDGKNWRITGDAIPANEAYGLMDQIKSYNASTPYDKNLKNGMTVEKGKKNYAYYKGEWYISEYVGASETKFDADIVNYILNGR